MNPIYFLWSSVLYNGVQPFVTSSVSGLNIALSNLVSKPFMQETKFHAHTEQKTNFHFYVAYFGVYFINKTEKDNRIFVERYQSQYLIYS